MTVLALSRIHFPVTNLGHGRRIGIWVQGCAIHCPGCISADTWPVRDEHRTELSAVLDRVAELLPESDGLTISGGEPTDQPAALVELLTGARRLCGDRTDWDILVYTGRSLDEASERIPDLTTLADVVVSEPFDVELVTDDLALRGSSNQVVTACSELGRRRYPEGLVDELYSGQRETLGICVDDQSIWLVGIPRPGDLQKLTESLADDGIDITRRSWLA